MGKTTFQSSPHFLGGKTPFKNISKILVFFLLNPLEKRFNPLFTDGWKESNSENLKSNNIMATKKTAKKAAKKPTKKAAKKAAKKAPKKLKPLTKLEVVSEIAETTGNEKKQVTETLNALAQLACKETKKNSSFTIHGVGKLVLVHRKARIGRNPMTGEKIKIPAKKVVKFRIAKSCKDAVLPPKK